MVDIFLLLETNVPWSIYITQYFIEVSEILIIWPTSDYIHETKSIKTNNQL
ncbi:hypothetical protein MYP_4596 [Sporocytophaga myxococcoides]|uniref:Uncharacterized protein n=1 Tax=Sporocytophaga myxococcoides TaxID=153721 RepID=A0A098LK56_9BACT|nr:hypothetical protein MYP_4596 [Sporocytophaga myxococcoides]